MFDTHTHFDFEVFAGRRVMLAQQAKQAGVERLVLAGYMAKYFPRLVNVQHELDAAPDTPTAHLAAGLHPDYLNAHSADDLCVLERFLHNHDCIAVGEIGLDTYRKENKTTDAKQKQMQLFTSQLELAKTHQLPALLHIRKSHAQAIALLQSARFTQGGIAHSFSGGIQEAKKFVDLGFKIGITAQVTNPNAKKLHSVVQALGAQHLVIETDCPDMLPHPLHKKNDNNTNVPAHLTFVLDGLNQLLNTPSDILKAILWQNSLLALNLTR